MLVFHFNRSKSRARIQSVPKNLPRIFPNSSCKSVIKSYLIGAIHTGVLFKNGLRKFFGKNFQEVIESGLRSRSSSQAPAVDRNRSSYLAATFLANWLAVLPALLKISRQGRKITIFVKFDLKSVQIWPRY